MQQLQPLRQLRCQNCGAATTYNSGKRLVHCTFCGSQFIDEQPSTQDGINVHNTFVVEDQFNEKRAEQIFQKWVSEGAWTPGDLKRGLRKNGLSLIYLPFWFFEVSAVSQWSGQYCQTHYRTVTKTRMAYGSQGSYEEHYVDNEPYDVWYPQNGSHSSSYYQLIVASSDFGQGNVDRLMSVNSSALDPNDFRPWSDEYLSEWTSATPTVSESSAEQICRARVYDFECAACARDAQQLQSVNSQISIIRKVLVYYPIWIGAYTYNGNVYRCIINGKTGDIIGKKPTSVLKISVAAALCIALSAVIVMWLSNFTENVTPKVKNNTQDGALASKTSQSELNDAPPTPHPREASPSVPTEQTPALKPNYSRPTSTPPPQLAAKISKGVHVWLHEGTTLYFNDSVYGRLSSADSFEVLQYAPEKKRVWILSKDSHGKPIAFNVSEEAIFSIDK